VISPNAVMVGSYDYRLVAVSVFIAIFASYAALDLAGRITPARGLARGIWLSGGATAMGIGIWSMHYVGMLAFRLPVPVLYDWPTVLASLLAAIFASATALFVVSRATMDAPRSIAGSLFMGAGIAAMHYIGMAAMRLPAQCDYSPELVIISVVLAIVISWVALWLTFRLRNERASYNWRKPLSALVMGAAIPVMHYTGMAAASFTPSNSIEGSLSHALNISLLGTVGIVIVTSMVLGLAILTSRLDRRFTAQALALESSRRAEEKFKNLVESAPDAIIIVDEDGKMVLVNAQAEKLFGYSRAELLQQEVEMLVPQRFRGEHVDQRTRFHGQRKSRMGAGFELELLAVRKGGAEFPVEITLSPLETQEGVLTSSAIRDITDRVQYERALKKAKEAAEAGSAAKSVFLATMSHEIRTPLNGILGMTELVLDSEITPDQRDSLSLVKLSAESLLGIINDILDFSKIETGKLSLEAIPFDLRESLGQFIKTLSFRAHQKGLELVYEVQPDVPETLVGDPGRIRQIIVNLVGNAIKFTSKGEIFVSVNKLDETPESVSLDFAVKDTGIGIPAEKQQVIFEPFLQADGSMARKYGGTGLGLAICSRLADLMLGRITVESELAKGSTFHFIVTLAVQQQTVSPRATLAPPPRLRGLPVLIVDDNYTNRRVLQAMLARWGMKPIAVEGGHAALQAIEVAEASGHPLPLVLLDGQMPEMDGFGVAEQIAKRPTSDATTIMMLTSAGHLGDAARCRDLGISAYLTKPVRSTELLEAICKALNPPAAPQQSPLLTSHVLRQERNRCHILLAEDNAVNQTLAVRLLEKRGYRVSVANNGREALAALEKENVDLILMDIQMPEMDGEEATIAIRQKERSTGKHIPIIAMTAHALKGDEERYLATGMDAYISKPIRTNEMFATIENCLNKTADAALDASGPAAVPVTPEKVPT
jgi:two-component system, sensor histidine kinase and response regulator